MSEIINENEGSRSYSAYVQRPKIRFENSCDYVLPDYMGDVKRLLKYSVHPAICDKYNSGNDLTMLCVLNYKVLYIDHEDILREAVFSSEAEISDRVGEGCLASEVYVYTDSVSIRLFGPRKICARATAVAQIGIAVQEELEACELPAEAEVNTERINVYTATVIDGAEREYAEQIARISGVGSDEVDVISCEATACVLSSQVSMGGISVDAYILGRALVCVGDDVFTVEKKIPLDANIAAEAFLTDDMSAFVHYDTSSVSISLNNEAEDSAGADYYTSVVLSFTAKPQVRCSQNITHTVTADAFVPYMENSAEYSDLCYDECIGVARERRNVSCEASRPEALLQSVICCDAHLRDVRYEADTDGVTVKAMAIFKALILADGEEKIICVTEECEICEFIKLSGTDASCNAAADISILECNAVFDEKKVYLTATLKIDVTATRKRCVRRLCSLMAKASESIDHPGITVYYPEKSETVWDVAKRYHVPVEIIRRYNAIQNTDVCAAALSEGENHVLIFNKRSS